ncbi:Furin-like protease 2 [Eumeta japonica]|uniref:Furin-like protease 2 n=1 Tax=Eumeta variegata TaxID=151549 RepID=A0A4C1WV59_EUMVA|nr:Furin-like protease 2 [Eumeta japonica]
MDAAQMVTLAEQWINVPPQHICKSQEINEDKPIEISFGYTISVHMDVNGCSGTVNEVRYLEHVQCKLSLSFFPRGNLRILLTSPMGTTSTLLFERTHDATSSNFDDWPFLSVHFWDENAEGRWTLQIINAGNNHVTQPGVLKKWQLIFYGTATNPVRLRDNKYFNSDNIRQEERTYHINDVYDVSEYSQFLNEIELGVSERRSNPKNIPSAQRKNVLSDANDRQIQRLCDPECDDQGCYGKGPTQCVACKRYRLDNSCVSRCPPRSFVNQGGVCWPCHESCETCAGAGQDSCLTCAPAHLLVTDLAVCLQQCPDGYYEDPDASACYPCAEHCDTCSEKSDMCSSCTHNYVLYNGSCLAACPPGTYQKDDAGCMPCHESCESCKGPSESACVSCRIGDYSFKGFCLSKCPTGYYSDNQRRECVRCVAECGQGYYQTAGKCSVCPHTCTTCVSRLNCTSCEGSLRLQSGTCRVTCAPGYYPDDGTCSKCYLSCETCSGPRRDQCGSCPPEWRVNHKCLPCCTESLTPIYLGLNQTIDCCHCDKEIGGCLNESSAGKRRIAESIKTHITASFFVDDTKDSPYIWDPDLIVAWICGFTLLTLISILIIVRIKYRRKSRMTFPRTEYSQLTTVDEDLVLFSTPCTKLKVKGMCGDDSGVTNSVTCSECEEPT